MSHTPGPWWYWANDLVDAAPDLLRACKDLLQCLEYVYRAHPATTGSLKATRDIKAAKIAIQKAEGPQ